MEDHERPNAKQTKVPSRNDHAATGGHFKKNGQKSTRETEKGRKRTPAPRATRLPVALPGVKKTPTKGGGLEKKTLTNAANNKINTLHPEQPRVTVTNKNPCPTPGQLKNGLRGTWVKDNGSKGEKKTGRLKWHGEFGGQKKGGNKWGKESTSS